MNPLSARDRKEVFDITKELVQTNCFLRDMQLQIYDSRCDRLQKLKQEYVQTLVSNYFHGYFYKVIFWVNVLTSLFYLNRREERHFEKLKRDSIRNLNIIEEAKNEFTKKNYEKVVELANRVLLNFKYQTQASSLLFSANYEIEQRERQSPQKSTEILNTLVNHRDDLTEEEKTQIRTQAWQKLWPIEEKNQESNIEADLILPQSNSKPKEGRALLIEAQENVIRKYHEQMGYAPEADWQKVGEKRKANSPKMEPALNKLRENPESLSTLQHKESKKTERNNQKLDSDIDKSFAKNPIGLEQKRAPSPGVGYQSAYDYLSQNLDLPEIMIPQMPIESLTPGQPYSQKLDEASGVEKFFMKNPIELEKGPASSPRVEYQSASDYSQNLYLPEIMISQTPNESLTTQPFQYFETYQGESQIESVQQQEPSSDPWQNLDLLLKEHRDFEEKQEGIQTQEHPSSILNLISLDLSKSYEIIDLSTSPDSPQHTRFSIAQILQPPSSG